VYVCVCTCVCTCVVTVPVLTRGRVRQSPDGGPLATARGLADATAEPWWEAFARRHRGHIFLLHRCVARAPAATAAEGEPFPAAPATSSSLPDEDGAGSDLPDTAGEEGAPVVSFADWFYGTAPVPTSSLSSSLDGTHTQVPAATATAARALDDAGAVGDGVEAALIAAFRQCSAALANACVAAHPPTHLQTYIHACRRAVTRSCAHAHSARPTDYDRDGRRCLQGRCGALRGGAYRPNAAAVRPRPVRAPPYPTHTHHTYMTQATKQDAR
jgi:hypothetical protein